MVAKLSRLLWAVLVFVAKPALADNVTYKQYSASSADWKRGFVFAVAQHQTTINAGEGLRIQQLARFSDASQAQGMTFLRSMLRHTSQEIQTAPASQWSWLL
jgi:hypothetical protein